MYSVITAFKQVTPMATLICGVIEKFQNILSYHEGCPMNLDLAKV